MKKIILLQTGIMLCFSAAKAQVNLVAELHHFAISGLPVYRTGTTVAEESTYDRTGGNNDGFNGTYSFVRRNPDSSLVLLDIDGPGEINRFATPTPTKDTLDFYIDNKKRPTLSICYNDLFSGKVYPFVAPLSDHGAGGYYTYFPILFQRHCRIVSRGKLEQFHQIQYRLFPKVTPVKSFSKKLDPDEQSALEQIAAAWSKPVPERFAMLGAAPVAFNGTLQQGKTITCLDVKHGGRLLGFTLGPSGAFAGNAKNLMLRITWDDEKEPAVYCPIADFFGYGFGKPAMSGILLGAKGDKCYSFIPMPFDHYARIELIYPASKDTIRPAITISAQFYMSSEKRNPKTEGKLYTQWAQASTRQGQFWQLAKIKGKGHYIGTILSGQGLKPGVTLFWEGDDETFADGKMTIHGTGTEDYFNGGWYAMKGRWDAPRSYPLSGCLDYSSALGHTGGYRFYLNDKLPFKNSLLERIEHGGEGNGVPAIYTSVAFYYADRPQTKE